MTSNVRIRIVRDGAEFEAEGTEEFVRDMLRRFEGEADSNESKTSNSESSENILSESSKRLSVREFLQKFGAKRHADRIVAFGYYLEKYLDKKEFTAADINNLYYEAKLETSNTSQGIINGIKRGLLMEAPGQKKRAGKKRYTLTQTGEEFVEKKLLKA